jgi:hypothetical protein
MVEVLEVGGGPASPPPSSTNLHHPPPSSTILHHPRLNRGISDAEAILFSAVESWTVSVGGRPLSATLEQLAAEAHSAESDSSCSLM